MENPDSEGKLIVIVGEKIKITEDNTVYLGLLPYGKFIAQYRILQKVCGDYNEDKITFIAYDHYGFPDFGNYKHALLFLNRKKDTIYHEMYQYFPLYKTKDGRWGSNYDHREYLREKSVKPEKIDFEEEVSFSIDDMTRATRQRRYPEPFYKIDIENKKAIAVFGNYVPELFQLKKEGVLKYRGFYGKIDPTINTPKEVTLTEFKILTKKDSLQLLKTWKLLLDGIKANKTQSIKEMSVDSIVCSACQGMPRTYYENNLESIDMFIDSANINFQKSGIWSTLKNSKLTFSVTSDSKNKPDIFSIKIQTKSKIENSIHDEYHTFEFIKKDNRFIFSAMSSY